MSTEDHLPKVQYRSTFNSLLNINHMVWVFYNETFSLNSANNWQLADVENVSHTNIKLQLKCIYSYACINVNVFVCLKMSSCNSMLLYACLDIKYMIPNLSKYTSDIKNKRFCGWIIMDYYRILNVVFYSVQTPVPCAYRKDGPNTLFNKT